jgi:hypothetical protein
MSNAEVIALIDAVLALPVSDLTKNDLHSFRMQVEAGTIAEDDRNYIIKLCQRLQQGKGEPSVLSGLDDNTAAPEKPNPLKISTSVVTALRDTGYAVSQLFVPALIAFLILLALWIVRSQVMPLTAGLIAVAAKLSHDALSAFLITPYAIAVHRFIILGERTMSYRIAPAEPKFRRFFGWSLALYVLFLPGAIPDILLPSMEPLSRNFLSIVLGIPGLVISIRAIVLFPAVAVDAPGVNWRQAMAATAGHAWRIFFILSLTIGVVFSIVAALIGFIMMGRPMDDAGVREAQGMAGGTIGALLLYTSLAAIASRIYQRIGVRVSSPSRIA